MGEYADMSMEQAGIFGDSFEIILDMRYRSAVRRKRQADAWHNGIRPSIWYMILDALSKGLGNG